MRAILHVLATCILLGAIAWWWQAGSNKGWTKTSVTEMKFDEITEIAYPVTVERFVPGVDFLAVAAVGSSVLAGAGLFLNRRRKPAA